MHLWFLVVQTLKIFGDAFSKFPATSNFVNDSNANHRTPKNNALIVIFNHQTRFSISINYHSGKNYLFFNINHQFLLIYIKTQKTYKNKKTYKLRVYFSVE